MAVTTLTDKVFVGDIGTAFRGTFKEDGTAIDISSASVMQIKFEKPDGTIVTQTASFFTDGTDGVIEYLSVSGDLSIGGKWRLQGFVTMASWTGHSDIVNFKVYDNLT